MSLIGPSKSPETGARPGAPSDDDLLDEIVAVAIESACRDHPRLEPKIRRRFQALREVGLLQAAAGETREHVPAHLGRYRLLERLGAGGMGVVFRAVQEPLSREVALKLIRPEHVYLPRARERFRREAEAIARLQHPSIVPVHDVGEEGGVPYFTMDLVPGATLESVLRELRGAAPESLGGADLERAVRGSSREPGPAPGEPAGAFRGTYVDAVLRIAIQAASALEHAHARDVLHRDVKPSNVAVTPDGRVLLFDFGLATLVGAARLTATHAEIGSLPYMSPEQIRGDPAAIDRRTDVYALGVTLYELLALQLPYSGRDLVETRAAILAGLRDPLRARNRAVPRDLEVVCAKALEPEPARRYATARELADDLGAVLEREPIRARPPSAAHVAARWMHRHPASTVAFAAALCLLTGVPTALYLQQQAHASELQGTLDALGLEQRKTAVAEEEARAQRDAARNEARVAAEINRFLVGMFGASRPRGTLDQEPSARDLLQRAAQQVDSSLAGEPAVRGSLYHALGAAYLGLGEYERAQPLLERALELREETAGKDSLPVAETLLELALLDRWLSRPTALERAQRSVDLFRRLGNEPDARTVRALNALASALDGAGRPAQSREVLLDALDVAEGLAGDERSLRATILNNLGELRVRLGELDEAARAAEQSLALQEELGPVPSTGSVTALNTQCLALLRMQRFDVLRPKLERLLDETREVYGEDSDRYASALVNHAASQEARGDREGAREDLELALAIFSRVAGPTHVNAMLCRRNLIYASLRAGRWDRAEELSEELLRLYRELGAAPAQSIFPWTALALCCEARGELARAEELARRAAEAGEALPPCAERDGGAVARCHWARWLARRGEVEEARAALGRLERADAEPDSLRHWRTIAEAALARAEGYRSAAIARLAEIGDVECGPSLAFWAPSLARAELGALLASEDRARAVALLERAAAELASGLGASHSEVARASQALEKLRR